MSSPDNEIQDVIYSLMEVAQLLSSYEFKFINGLEQNLSSGIYPSRAQKRRAHELLAKYDEDILDGE